jgi:hypothetical protein
MEIRPNGLPDIAAYTSEHPAIPYSKNIAIFLGEPRVVW